MIAGATESHRFTVGDFECAALSDGNMDHPSGHLFANVPQAQIQEGLRRYNLPTDCVVTPCTHLFVNTGEQCVLVDAGMGSLAPSTGRLPENMRTAGVEPGSIDTVILTHAHPAQIGGLLDGAGKPVYINARYHLWKGEWEFWTAEGAFSKAPERHIAIARKNLDSIWDRLCLVDCEGEIVPGVGIVSAPGHTPGQLVVSVSSDDERLLYVSDIVLHPLHLEHPDWISIYDILPKQAAASKRRILDLAVEEKALLCAHHFSPFPSLGYIVRKGQGWRWLPIKTKGSGPTHR
jgi:glyoxylase-like metal-dependent hydrolase (beta-lactamase superfamily II)